MKRLILLTVLGTVAVVVGSIAAQGTEPSGLPEGFVTLFNGKDLGGWVSYGGNEGDWTVENGLIVTPGRKSCWLMTEKEYGDFTLYVEYRIAKRGNSGIALRAPLKGDPAFTGMEVQILDDASYPDQRPSFYNGSVWDVVGPSKQVAAPPGQWNALLITIKGRRIVVRLNRTVVVNTDLDQFRGQADRHPGLLRQRGHIGLQSYTGPVEFRKIWFRAL
jgi:hypothetical protein